MKKKTLGALTITLMIYYMTGCSLGGGLPGNGTEIPTSISVENMPSGGGVEVISTSSFTDSAGRYYVVGEVINNLDTPVTSIELIISVADSSGTTLLRDESGNAVDSRTFFTLLSTLNTGETSPFSYYLDTSENLPANYAVTVLNFDVGSTNRAPLQNENVQIIDDGNGFFILTGELVNLSSEWVHITGLAGGVLDDSDKVLSANWTGTYASALAPAGDLALRDRTPYQISFPVPEIPATKWQVWWDADIMDDVIDYSLNLEVTNFYFDEYGSAHIVGVIKNDSETVLNSLIVAGLYAEDETVLDASYSFLPTSIQPGVIIPFDVSYFGSVNLNEEQAALVDKYSVQIDPWNTYPPAYESAAIETAGEAIQQNGTTWIIEGTFTNTTTESLSAVTIMTMIYDIDENLVAMGYTFSYPTGEVFLPSDTGTYEITLYISPDVDPGGFTTQTLAVGEVSE